jgi:hypothetical protein
MRSHSSDESMAIDDSSPMADTLRPADEEGVMPQESSIKAQLPLGGQLAS